MEKTIEFLTGKRVNDVVNPHTKHTKGYEWDLVRFLTPRAWLNDVVILNDISLLVDNLSDIVELQPDVVIDFNRNKAKTIKCRKKQNSSKNYNYTITANNPNQNHWALLVLDVKQRIINSFDSFNKMYKKESELVVSF